MLISWMTLFFWKVQVYRMLQYFYKNEYHPILDPGYIPKPEYICHVGSDNSHMPRTMHSHDNLIEILLVYEGAGIYIIDQKRYTAKKGDLILYNSKVVHDEFGGSGNNLCTYCLAISNLKLTHLEKNKIIDDKYCPVVSCKDSFEDILQLFQLIEKNRNNKHTTEITLPLSMALVAKTKTIIDENAVLMQNDHSPLTQKVIEYINQHYKESLRLSDLAAHVGVNEYYLSHFFKNDVGFSPMQYVILRRIGEAQNLLINTDMSITNIAVSVGYNNSNYFQNVFRKTFGMTPGEYRQKWVKP